MTIAALVPSFASAQCPNPLPYVGIESSPFFPRPLDALIAIREHSRPGEDWKQAYQLTLLHAWEILAGMTRKVSPSCLEPAWRTWYGADDILSPTVPSNRGARLMRFEKPGELDASSLHDTERSGGPLFSKVMFNRTAAQHIIHFGLNRATVLAKHISTGDREVPEFPRNAVAIKTIWRRVPADPQQNLVLGIWDPTLAKGEIVPEYKWARCVHVTKADSPPPGNSPCWPDSPAVGPAVNYREFYNIPVVNPQAVQDLIPSDQRNDLKVGDVLIMVGMHATTKEIPDWFWATYWWNPFVDFQGRPGTWQRPWSNYTADATMSMTFPMDVSYDSNRRTIYNPYLEAVGLNHGTSSNCMTCHSRASYRPGPPIPRNEVDGYRNADPLNFFEGRIRTGFLWSLVVHATGQ